MKNVVKFEKSSKSTPAVGVFVSIVNQIKKRYQRRRAIEELRALSDVMLHDIGLHRSQIVAAVDGLLDTPSLQVVVQPADAAQGATLAKAA